MDEKALKELESFKGQSPPVWHPDFDRYNKLVDQYLSEQDKKASEGKAKRGMGGPINRQKTPRGG